MSEKRPSCISDRNDFSSFLPTNHPDSSYQVSSQLAFQFWRSKQYIFKLAAILDFRSELLFSQPDASDLVSRQLAFHFWRRTKK